MDLARSILAVNTNRYGGDFFQSRHKSWTRVSMRLRFAFWVRICKFIFFESCNFVSCFTHTHTHSWTLSLSLSYFQFSITLTLYPLPTSLSTISLPHSVPSPSLTLYHLPPSLSLSLSHVVYHLFTPFLSNTQISNLQSNYLYEVPMYSLSLLSLWWPFLSLSPYYIHTQSHSLSHSFAHFSNMRPWQWGVLRLLSHDGSAAKSQSRKPFLAIPSPLDRPIFPPKFHHTNQQRSKQIYITC